MLFYTVFSTAQCLHCRVCCFCSRTLWQCTKYGHYVLEYHFVLSHKIQIWGTLWVELKRNEQVATSTTTEHRNKALCLLVCRSHFGHNINMLISVPVIYFKIAYQEEFRSISLLIWIAGLCRNIYVHLESLHGKHTTTVNLCFIIIVEQVVESWLCLSFHNAFWKADTHLWLVVPSHNMPAMRCSHQL